MKVYGRPKTMLTADVTFPCPMTHTYIHTYICSYIYTYFQISRFPYSYISRLIHFQIHTFTYLHIYTLTHIELTYKHCTVSQKISVTFLVTFVPKIMV
ncbi:hypothetical protein BDF14DRAFT_1842513 [Spinellus fusiger]|nr:hypothetical protein BDF14DRAFT_1842512 [Spinellus fusiger]KAI7863603.1 hypothetical protein BDF14DRAFT_1842513 [Spinellus fusiger]